MNKKVWIILLLVGLVTVFAEPALATTGVAQGGGGVRLGPFTLEAENTTSGDLVVFGGPVTLEENSHFNGDLTVFGYFTMSEGATLNGQLVVLGEAAIGGMVDGNVFVAGPVNLAETATIDGDLSVVGQITQDEGAIVKGEIIPIDESDWNFPINIDIPGPIVSPSLPQSGVVRMPFWLRTLTAIAQALVSILILTLLSLVVVSLWPQQIERVGRTIEEALLISYGTGLLTLVVAVLAAVLLAITICLSPFALLILIALSLGGLMGWIALGLVLGRRVLSSLFNQPQPKLVLAAVIGTGLITTLLAMSQVFNALQALLFFILIPPAVGAVLLTRFGTLPYATRGGTGVVTGSKPATPSSPTGPKKAPLPGETINPQQDENSSGPSTEVDDAASLSSAVGMTKVIDLDEEGVANLNVPGDEDVAIGVDEDTDV
jgi:cytoskeletal protein CcmA (bactofilin family)